jgi:hypothetical protein
MGSLGDSAPVHVPVPPMNFAATIGHQSDLSTTVERFSIEGKTTISGKFGSGRISIGFERIASIRFVHEGESLRADAALKDGDKLPVVVSKGMTCYGELPYGDMQIPITEIKAITMHGQVSEKATGQN